MTYLWVYDTRAYDELSYDAAYLIIWFNLFRLYGARASVQGRRFGFRSERYSDGDCPSDSVLGGEKTYATLMNEWREYSEGW
jgi:hypothetical protein